MLPLLRLAAASNGQPLAIKAAIETIANELGPGNEDSLKDAGQAVGRSNDGGIDGVITKDKLGLDLVYLQARRWESTAGRREIRQPSLMRNDGSTSRANHNEYVFGNLG